VRRRKDAAHLRSFPPERNLDVTILIPLFEKDGKIRRVLISFGRKEIKISRMLFPLPPEDPNMPGIFISFRRKE